jgi:hypothetical protein
MVRGCRWIHKSSLLSPLGISKRQALKQKVSLFLRVEKMKEMLSGE